MKLTLAEITESAAIELLGLPGGWSAFLLLAVTTVTLLLVVYLYQREGRAGVGATLRYSLAVARCVVLVGLAAIWLRPAIATYAINTVAARVGVLIDVSESMSIADPALPDDRTRLAAVERLLNAERHDWLRRLAARNQLSVLTFGERSAALSGAVEAAAPATTSAPAVTGAEVTPFDLTGALDAAARLRTDMGSAVQRLIDEFGPAPAAGIVLITDGQANKGMPLEELSEFCRRRKAPLYVVGVGGITEPPNLRITQLSAPPAVPRGDPFEIKVEVGVTGVEGPLEVEVELLARPADSISGTMLGAARGEPRAERPDTGATPTAGGVEAGGAEEFAADALLQGETRLAARTVELAPGADATLTFEARPDVAGETLYRARVRPLRSEPVMSDNARETAVLVLQDLLRVLLVAGRPSYDYRYVSRLLERDKSVNVSCWLQSADERAVRDGDEIVTELPRDIEKLFAYDAIFLFDPNPADLDPGWAALVKRFVDEAGGGLLVQAGLQFTPRFLTDARVADIVSILPVSPDPEAELRLSDLGTFRDRAFALQIPEVVRGHPLLALRSAPLENAEEWRKLPGVWWHLPVLREKPVATVLLQHSAAAFRSRFGPDVLFAVQPYGSGRTAFLGFDSTWRWRAVAEPVFNRFWVQMVRYLAQARREGASRRGVITIDRDAPSVGDFLKIEARVLDRNYLPWHEPRVEAALHDAAGTVRPVSLEADPAREGWYTGRILLEQGGAAALRLELPDADAMPTTNSSSAEPVGGAAGAADSNSAPAGPSSARAGSSSLPEGPTTNSAAIGVDSGVLTKRFRVNRPDYELRALRQRDDLLRRLATETGGRYVPLSEAGALPDWIENASRSEPPRRVGVQELWDETWVMLALAALLAGELWLRRRNHLL